MLVLKSTYKVKSTSIIAIMFVVATCEEIFYLILQHNVTHLYYPSQPICASELLIILHSPACVIQITNLGFLHNFLTLQCFYQWFYSLVMEAFFHWYILHHFLGLRHSKYYFTTMKLMCNYSLYTTSKATSKAYQVFEITSLQVHNSIQKTEKNPR